MRVLLDTNVLLRLSHVADKDHAIAISAVEKLRAQGDELCCTAQSLRELWHVATRSIAANGLGHEPSEVEEVIRELDRELTVLFESAESFAAWRTLASAHSVRGAVCHDANHIAIAASNGVNRIVTMDVAHFRRLVPAHLEVTHPQDV